MRKDFAIPNELHPSVIVGFGYPLRNIKGKRKNRVSIIELMFYEKYGTS